jgi:hypothetical protein
MCFSFGQNAVCRSIYLFIPALLFFNLCKAQTPAFSPAPEDAAHLQSLYANTENSYKQHVSKLPSENKKDYQEVYKMMWENIKEKFDEKEIYTAKDAQAYLESLSAEIVKANPLLQGKSFQAFFSRSGVPNASYIGEGIILFNMGLFYRLDNESQAAFVLSHELAHFYLNHIGNKIDKYVSTINSEEFQKELKKIKNSEFRKREQLENLLKGITFKGRKHSRENESQADSMAVEFMRNTRFDIIESLSALALLDKIDTDTLKVEPCLQRLFNAKEYPFQKKWIAKEEGLLGGHALIAKDEKLADSMKTHPDCQLRIKTLEPMVSKYSAGNHSKDVINRTRFDELRQRFSFETIEYAFTANNYTRSLLYTLELLQQYPSDPYLVSQVGRIFNGMYAAQKSHTLTKVIEFPSPYHQANYNLLLQFVQNLYVENFASISYHFLKQYNAQLTNYAPFKTAYNTSIQIAQQ